LTGSFRLYKADIFKNLISVVKNSGYAFQMEMVVRALYNGWKVEEVPITFVDRIMGKSKLGFSEIIVYFNCVMKLYVTL
jgi:dolichol-phosphate mannosyltransferase